MTSITRFALNVMRSVGMTGRILSVFNESSAHENFCRHKVIDSIDISQTANVFNFQMHGRIGKYYRGCALFAVETQ